MSIRFISRMKNNKKIRFVSVGITNTIIDFGIYGGLVAAGIPSVIANYPAATTALTFSFFANKNYTFQKRGHNLKQIVLFLAVTLAGAWIIQPAVIYIVSSLLFGLHETVFIVAMIAKVCAAIISMAWNYTLYNKFVFPS